MAGPVYISGTSIYGYGGAQHSYSPYGSGAFPRPPVAVDGGYGGQQYGYNSYGSLDITPPRISSAVSLDGFRIELFFSEEMRDDANLVNPAKYKVSPVLGAPSASVSVAKGTAGVGGGYTSVILTHTGTTLGGSYTVAATNIQDLAGNVILAVGASLITLGDIPTVDITSGTTSIRLAFLTTNGDPQDMLEESVVSPGIEDAGSYSIYTDYVVTPSLGAVTHPVGGDASLADIAISNFTSASYDLVVGPATALDYDGSVTPDADPGFTGTEIGTGSSAGTVSGLVMTKSVGVTYGWSFADISGRLIPGSTFRQDITFDVTAATLTPALFDTLFATASFSDGSFQVDVAIERIAGTDYITVTSGAFSQQVAASWSGGSTTISMLQNQQAGHVSILVNDTPLITGAIAAFTGPAVLSPGCSFVLSTNYEVAGFLLEDVLATSTQTVFTSSWNFLHNVTTTFTGLGLSRSVIRTERGPLVKTWGDSTPATKNDVEVRVNGTAVDIESVNPYTGDIYPTIPIPLAAAGTNTVEVDYAWMPNPSVSMLTNTEGLVTNKSDWHVGNTSNRTNPQPSSSTGAPDTQRFPYTAVIGDTTPVNPKLIGHRYLGFERNYSALTNSPTTLLTNADPHRFSKPEMEEFCVVDSARWEAELLPGAAETPWTLRGTDAGSLVGDGTYTLIDDQAGTFATGDAAVYYRDVSATCDYAATQVARYKVLSYMVDGVYTGIGFGFHDNYKLYLVGNLVLNGLRHVGLLTDPENPHLAESWVIGPSATITITGEHTFTVPSGEWPSNTEVGDQVQILDGNQAGIYTISQCGIDDFDGTVTVTIDETFPADFTSEGNDTAIIYFETKWDEFAITYRLITDTSTATATLFIGGTLADGVVTVTDPASLPAESALLIPTGDTGMSMFGSFSREAVNETLWSFFRHALTPDLILTNGRGFVVEAPMDTLPEDESDAWFLTNSFGYSELAGGGTMYLKSLSGSDTLDLTYGYARLEPFLSRPNQADLDLEFRVDHAVLPATEVARLRDDLRDIRLMALLYEATGSGNRLIKLPRMSFSGLRTLEQEGWTSIPTPTFSEAVRGELLTHTQTTGQFGTWYSDLDTSDTDTDAGRALEARFRVDSYTEDPVNGLLGAFIGINVNDSGTIRRVGFSLRADPAFEVVLTGNGSTDVASFPFAWDDGEFHTIRVKADTEVIPATVTVMADNTVLGSVNLSLFPADPDSGTEDRAYVKMVDTDRATVITWDEAAFTGLPTSTYSRTLGLWTGGDLDEIDSYKVPRTDGTTSLNSSASATLVAWNWTSYMSVRLHLDPAWGVSLFRPDLALPPGYTGTYATETTDPTAAWVNLEYKQIPRHYDVVGSVYFGSLDSRDISSQRWDRVKYRIYNVPDEDYIQPQGMVTNRFNVIHSGELNKDTTPEVVVITSLTSTMLSIWSANITADRVFFVQVDGTLLGASEWSFDKATQTVAFTSPLPSDRYPVTVTFAADKPITESYLQRPALDESRTLLNEGTPPFPKSQIANANRSLIEGDLNNDPSGALNANAGFVAAEPWNIVNFDDVADTYYEELSFFELDNGGNTGWISSICDGPAPEHGWTELSLDGTPGAYTEQSQAIAGTASQFDQTSVFLLGGGHMPSTNLSGGTSPLSNKLPVLYPNYQGTRSESSTPLKMAMNQEFRLKLADTWEEDLDIEGTWGDNVPPSVVGAVSSNPNGTPGTTGNGAVVYALDDYAGDGISRLGPWGGLGTLEPNSLLGGGAPLTGDEFTLQGGTELPGPTRTTGVIEAAN